MRKIMLVAGLTLALAACGKNKFEKALSAMEDAKDKVCKCTDTKCAEDAQKELFEKLAPMMADDDKEKPPKDVDEKADKIMKEMTECEKKLKSGGKDDKKDAPKP